MNKLTWLLVGIGVVAAAAFVVVKQQRNPPQLRAEIATQSAETPAPSSSTPARSPSVSANAPEPAIEDHDEPAIAPAPTATPDTSAATSSIASTFSQPLQILVSPQSSYPQKQAAWKQLRETGQLDQAITQLKQAVQEAPSASSYSAALGEAYLQKLGPAQDPQEQSTLAVEADHAFDQALKLDPYNWDARFWKATALSYWPPELNKSQEIMENLSTLIDQQEVHPPQPEYAQSYVLLGEQYQKAGYPDNAREMWQRGAALFPQNETLQRKLASSP